MPPELHHRQIPRWFEAALTKLGTHVSRCQRQELGIENRLAECGTRSSSSGTGDHWGASNA